MQPSFVDKDQLLHKIIIASHNMSGWLKLVGVVTFISGLLTALSVVGIIFAWLPIWLGVLLFQAGKRADEAYLRQRPDDLETMLNKLRLYFMIQGILLIIGLIVTIIIFFGFSVSMLPFLESFDY